MSVNQAYAILCNAFDFSGYKKSFQICVIQAKSHKFDKLQFLSSGRFLSCKKSFDVQPGGNK
jgi:hypothetical protein